MDVIPELLNIAPSAGEIMCDPGWYVQNKWDDKRCSEGLGAFRFFFKHTHRGFEANQNKRNTRERRHDSCKTDARRAVVG